MLGIYVRLSQVDDSSNSIENQLRQGKEFAKNNNLEFEIFNEGQGLSGGLGEDGRPELKRLLDSVRDGSLTAVWIRDQKRIERNTELYLSILSLFKKHNINYYVNDAVTDVSKPEIALHGTIFSAFAQFQKDQQGEMTKKSINDNFKQSKSHGILPYGLTKDANRNLIINEDEAEVVKRIFAMSLDGIGTNKIAEILNAEGVPTRYNSMKGTVKTVDKNSQRVTVRKKSDIKWSGNSIRGIITNPAHKGQRRSGIKTNLQHHPCPAIFEEHYWNKVNQNLQSNRNNSGKVVEHKYLLKGIVRCGKCGRNYYGRTRVNKKDNYYMCSSKRIKTENCGNRSINIDVLENLIWSVFVENGTLLQLIKEHFADNKKEDVLKELTATKEQYQKELNEVNRQLKRLIELALNGTFTDAELFSTKKELKTAKNDLDLKIIRIDERLQSFINSENEISNAEADLKKVSNYSFIEKQEVLKKYLYGIQIRYREDLNRYFEGGEYFVNIDFKMPNMRSFLYVLNRSYTEQLIVKRNPSDEDGTVYLDYDIFENY